MSQQSVLTTGANSGIGLQTAIEVARLGYHSVGSVRSKAKAQALVAAAKEAGVEVHPVVLDVTDRVALQATINDLRDVVERIASAGPAEAQPSGTAETSVVAGPNSYHRASCRIIEGQADLVPMAAATARRNHNEHH